MADTASILSKLYSGQTLTAQEKYDIGIGPAPTVSRLDALAAANQANATSTINQLKELGVGGSPTSSAPGPISSGTYLSATPEGYGAKSDPLKNKAVKPDAPAGYHYTWIGGTTTGSWVLYKDAVIAPTSGGGGGGGVITPTGSTTTTPTPVKDNTPSQSAQDYIRSFLNDAGLGALAGKVWSQWTSGQSEDQIVDWIRSTPEYATRFPAMATLRKDGRSISEAQYIAKEQADIDLMTQYGIPDAFAKNKDLLGKLIANNVSQVTLQKRLIAGQDTILGYDKSILDYAKKTYGLTPGDLLAWSLNPDIALPVIEQQAQAMRIGGAALTAGYTRGLGVEGELGKTQAEALATQGITQQQAQQGFTQLSQMGQLEQNLPGDVSGALTSQEMIDAIFGISGGAQEKLGKVKSTRVGEFQQGGGFATTQAGVGGIGQAPSV